MRVNKKEQIYSFPLNSGAVVYFKKYDAAIYCDIELESEIHELGNSIVSDIIPEDKINSHCTLSTEGSEFMPEELVILPSNKCNLNCQYCYSEASEENSGDVSIDAVIASIDLILKKTILSKRKYISLMFHGGGEPLHPESREVVLAALKYANEKTKEFNIELKTAMATNGTYFDDNALAIIKQIDRFNISLDGPEYVHDFHRPKGNGEGSFKDVMEFVLLLKKENKKININTVVSEFSTSRLNEIIDLYHRIGVTYAHIEPLHATEKSLKHKEIAVPDNKSFFSNYIKARNKAKKLGIELTTSSDGLFHADYFCSAFGSSYHLIPGNYVSGCVEVCSNEHKLSNKFIIGNYNKKNNTIDLDTNKVSDLKNKVILKDNCKYCIAQNSCQGGCPMKFLNNNKNSSVCDLNRNFFVENLKDYILEQYTISNIE